MMGAQRRCLVWSINSCFSIFEKNLTMKTTLLILSVFISVSLFGQKLKISDDFKEVYGFTEEYPRYEKVVVGKRKAILEMYRIMRENGIDSSDVKFYGRSRAVIFHQENTRSDGVTGFLWFPYESKAHLEVTTHLDFVAQRWSEIEEIFRQDLIRLCLMDGWGEEDKVVCLEWSVVTDKATVCPILINFRMPHHLRGENPHHKTTLRQAHYSFEKIDYYLSGFNLFKIKSILDNTEDSVQIEDDLDSLGESGIVSWDLKIKDRVIVPSYMKTLFGFQSSNSSLYSLMNRVKVDMWSFDFLNDWLPEDSFRKSVDIIGVDSLVDQPGDDRKYEKKAHRGKKNSSENLPKKTTSKSTSSRYLLPYFDRPLFLFESSQPTSIPQGPMIFKERTLDKWWKSKDGNYRRDYYINFLDNKCF